MINTELKDVKSIKEILEKNNMFRGALNETVEYACESPLLSEKHYQGGESIVEPGSTLHAVGIILSGGAVITREDGAKKVLLNSIGEGGSFGYANLFGDIGEYLTHICARGNTHVLYIPEELINVLILRDRSIAVSLISILSAKVRFLNSKIASFTADSAEEKLYLLLCSKPKKNDGSCDESSNFAALARQIDVGRSSFYRALDLLESKGRIKRAGKRLFIL